MNEQYGIRVAERPAAVDDFLGAAAGFPDFALHRSESRSEELCRAATRRPHRREPMSIAGPPRTTRGAPPPRPFFDVRPSHVAEAARIMMGLW